MLMDNMAYLQQISGGNNSPVLPSKKEGSILSKILNVKVIIAVVGFIVALILIGIVGSLLGKVDTKDQDLMQHSIWQAKYFNNTTVQKYSGLVNDSQIRNMSASLSNLMNEIQVTGAALMSSEFGVDVNGQEGGSIATVEKQNNDTLNASLENGRLNGLLDRVYVREVTMQIANARAYQSGVSERTKNAKVQEFSKRMTDSLDALYNQFRDYKSLAM